MDKDSESPAGAYIRIAPGTSDECIWPDPSDPTDIVWALTHGTPTREQLLTAASYIGAYGMMFDQPVRTTQRRIRQIRAHLVARATDRPAGDA